MTKREYANVIERCCETLSSSVTSVVFDIEGESCPSGVPFGGYSIPLIKALKLERIWSLSCIAETWRNISKSFLGASMVS